MKQMAITMLSVLMLVGTVHAGTIVYSYLPAAASPQAMQAGDEVLEGQR